MEALSHTLMEYGFHWFWFAVATVLMVIEVMVGRFLAMAASVGAVIVGALSSMYSFVGFEVQILFFLVLSSALMWLTRSYLKERDAKNYRLQDIVQNQRYVGREFALVNPIKDGYSSINIDGVVWGIEGKDIPEGRTVRITAMGEGTLQVEAV